MTHFPTKRIPLSRDLRSAVWDMTGGRCWYCGHQTNPFADFCVDHVVPIALAGDNDIENLVPCCSGCNSEKHARTVEQWRSVIHVAWLGLDVHAQSDERFWFEGGTSFIDMRIGHPGVESIRGRRENAIEIWRMQR